VRLPGLARYDFSVPDGLLFHVRPATGFDFEPAVLVAGDGKTLGDAGAQQNLDPVADGKDPFVLLPKSPNDLVDSFVVPDLPEGQVIELIPLDEVISTEGDDLDDQERAALHRSIDESIEDEQAGNVEDLSKIIAELRAQL
jgi:hypothetical protein